MSCSPSYPAGATVLRKVGRGVLRTLLKYMADQDQPWYTPLEVREAIREKFRRKVLKKGKR